VDASNAGHADAGMKLTESVAESGQPLVGTGLPASH
jgi:hypothetical protein